MKRSDRQDHKGEAMECDNDLQLPLEDEDLAIGRSKLVLRLRGGGSSEISSEDDSSSSAWGSSASEPDPHSVES